MSKIGQKFYQAEAAIIRPQITEKSTALAAAVPAVYTFRVNQTANKSMVKNALQKIYGVHPRRVNFINVQAKTIAGRGRRGRTAVGRVSGFKKALVVLRSGEKIDFV